MSKNPCRKCTYCFVWKGRHMPNGLDSGCKNCSARKKHEEYLATKRKYREGEVITSLDELLEQEFVMWFHTIRHIEVIKHTQLAMVLKWLKIGSIRKAVKNEFNRTTESFGR